MKSALHVIPLMMFDRRSSPILKAHTIMRNGEGLGTDARAFGHAGQSAFPMQGTWEAIHTQYGVHETPRRAYPTYFRRSPCTLSHQAHPSRFSTRCRISPTQPRPLRSPNPTLLLYINIKKFSVIQYIILRKLKKRKNIYILCHLFCKVYKISLSS